jgi:hypothetical protein
MENHLDGYSRLLSEHFSSAFSDPAFSATSQVELFPDTARSYLTKILQFTPRGCIKRRCCRPQPQRMTPPCVAPSDAI